jgi:hypothetical protein
MRTSDERWARLVAARVELERLTREAARDALDSLRAERLREAQVRVDELVADWNATISWGPPPRARRDPSGTASRPTPTILTGGAAWMRLQHGTALGRKGRETALAAPSWIRCGRRLAT